MKAVNIASKRFELGDCMAGEHRSHDEIVEAFKAAMEQERIRHLKRMRSIDRWHLFGNILIILAALWPFIYVLLGD